MDLLEHAYRLTQAGQPFVLATVVRAERPTSAKPGARGLVTGDGKLTGWVGGSCAEPTVIREARRALADGEPRLLRLCPPEKMTGQSQPGVVETVLTCASGGTLEIYLEPHLAQPQLVVVSHQPVAEALTALGRALGFAVTVTGVDVSPQRFPQAHRLVPDLKFNELTITPNSYIVVASHGNYDEDALEWALATPAAYIALIASPKRALSIRAYLSESGLTEAQLARLKAPAGLDLGAVTPEEIALSVLAEIVQLRRRRVAGAEPATRGALGSLPVLNPTTGDRPPTTDGGGRRTEEKVRTDEQHDRAAHSEQPHPAHEHHAHQEHDAHDHSAHNGHDHASHAPSPPTLPDKPSGATQPATAIDPVCGMTVETAAARYTTEHTGQMYYFCCPACRRMFQKEPAKYLAA